MPSFHKNATHVTLFTEAETSDTNQCCLPREVKDARFIYEKTQMAHRPLCSIESAIVISAVVIAIKLERAGPLQR